MKTQRTFLATLNFALFALAVSAASLMAQQNETNTTTAASAPVKVNALNFARAETDMYFSRSVKLAGGLG